MSSQPGASFRWLRECTCEALPHFLVSKKCFLCHHPSFASFIVVWFFWLTSRYSFLTVLFLQLSCEVPCCCSCTDLGMYFQYQELSCTSCKDHVVYVGPWQLPFAPPCLLQQSLGKVRTDEATYPFGLGSHMQKASCSTAKPSFSSRNALVL